jgi:hypothetical protein
MRFCQMTFQKLTNGVRLESLGGLTPSRSAAMACEVRNGDVRLPQEISENIGAIFFLTVFRRFLNS